ncbi:hypothetical protein DSECCO2_465890 [anaerobic digester metagenome]|mgnify:CR=1 FL=1
MGIPLERLLEIAFPPERCYEIMRNHYLEFIRQWYDELLQDFFREEYLTSHPALNEQEILNSFEYIRSLPEEPSKDDILTFAINVRSGCLAYSYPDRDLFESLEMGQFADFVVRKLG